MKKITCVFSVILLIFCFSIHSYSKAKNITFGAGAGLGIPLGDWADAYNIGFGLKGNVFYSIRPLIDIVGNIELYRFTGGVEGSMGGIKYEWDYSLTRLCFAGDGRYTFKGKFKFFAQAGLGLYYDMSKIKFDSESVSDNDTNVGLRFGGGIAFGNIEIIGMFHLVEDSNMLTINALYRF